MWKLLVGGIEAVPNPPDWLREVSRLPFGEVKRLPKVDNARRGRTARPSAVEKVVAADYLEFLREQIRLEPRGPQWNEILRARLAALEPVMGRSILTGNFYKLPDSATVQVESESGRLVHFEVL